MYTIQVGILTYVLIGSQLGFSGVTLRGPLQYDCSGAYVEIINKRIGCRVNIITFRVAELTRLNDSLMDSFSGSS